MVSSGAAQACLLVLLCSGSAMAKMSRWERVLQAGADATVSQAPAVAPAAAVDSGPLGAMAPAPAPMAGPPPLPKASDALALTNSSLNQLQTLGTYQSDHVAPPSAVLQLLNGSGYQQALGQNPYYAPQSFQYTLPDIFFQLDALGIRQFHFNAWKDPNGTLAAHPAGLKLAGTSNVTLDPKYSYFGYKTFGDPDFDFQSSCVTLETCLQLIQSWSVNHTDHIPITVYLEPREQTLLGNSSSLNQQLASQPGEPQQLAVPYPINGDDLVELQNTVYRVFNQSAIILPGSLLGNDSTLQVATQKAVGGSWPEMETNRGRVLFVMVDSAGKYGDMYRQLFPDLRNATFFVSQPGNGNATIDNSTVFLDYLGPLGGGSVATWTNTSANAAVKKDMARVQAAVRKGFMARVAADWQTVEAREDYHNRSMDAIKAGTHFLQTSFPNVAQLPKFAYSVLGSSNATYTNYTVSLPLRLGGSFNAGRCNPQTSAGIVANETASGCGSAADNALLAPAPGPATAVSA
ncbi:hypothetical protein CVIRNUC_008667 [Coccomyxa viridis]|uniref:Uncharacterized protein n=1 Tax=Coccomyxa viridis TaxID=1274662 RepID=A0AAV1IHP5_9CHLO|nr:hypothetical protein CVIRNUC_008667 [Coccomyxa viridis]